MHLSYSMAEVYITNHFKKFNLYLSKLGLDCSRFVSKKEAQNILNHFDLQRSEINLIFFLQISLTNGILTTH